eukprot:2051636-Rhodomonas_salina.1
MVRGFESSLREAMGAPEVVGGGGERKRSVQRLRSVLLHALLECLQSAEGAAVCGVVLQHLAGARPARSGAAGAAGAAGAEPGGKSGKGKGKGKGKKSKESSGEGASLASSERQHRIELATLLTERLSSEADEGVPLTTVLVYLDLVSAVWGLGSADGRAWQGVCKTLVRLLYRLNVAHPRAWKRALTFTFAAMSPGPAALLACRLLSSVALDADAEPNASADTEPNGAPHAEQDVPELAREAVRGIWAKLGGWALPVLSDSAAVSAVLSVSLHALFPLFAQPPDWACVLAGAGSQDERELCGVLVQVSVPTGAVALCVAVRCCSRDRRDRHWSEGLRWERVGGPGGRVLCRELQSRARGVERRAQCNAPREPAVDGAGCAGLLEPRGASLGGRRAGGRVCAGESCVRGSRDARGCAGWPAG